MATIQRKNSRGHKYWYIVESRRVNGKPRPIVLEYLGKADDSVFRFIWHLHPVFIRHLIPERSDACF